MAELGHELWDQYIGRGLITLDSRLIELAERAAGLPILYFVCRDDKQRIVAIFCAMVEEQTAYLATSESSGRHYWYDESVFNFHNFTSEALTLLTSTDYNCNEISLEGLSNSDCSAANGAAEMGWITSSITLGDEPQSLDSYIGSLKSKYRNDIRKYRLAMANSNLRAEVITNYLSMESEYYPLFLEVSSRADEYKPTPLGSEYFRLAKDIFGDDAVMVSLFNPDGRLMGYMLTLCNATGCVMQYTGFELDRELYLWHNITIETIGFALSRGLTFVDMGITNHRAKRQFGAQNHQTYSLSIKL